MKSLPSLVRSQTRSVGISLERSDGIRLLTWLVVRQSNSVMLREVSALRAFLSIIEASHGDEDTLHDLGLAEMTERYRTFGELISVLADQTDTWQSQLATEKAARARHHLASETGWTWTPAAQRRLEYARDCLYSLTDQSEEDWELVDALIPHPSLTLRTVVATVLNAFPPLLEWNLSGMGQRPGSDLMFGVRPLIYHMIREDLLGENEIRLCRNKSCGNFFRADRRDQKCCSDECSGRVRYQKYYVTKRKPARLESRKLPG